MTTPGNAELHRLVEGAIRNAGRLSNEPKPRWVHVTEALGIGSTRAIGLCCYYVVNPDEEVGIPDPEREGLGEG